MSGALAGLSLTSYLPIPPEQVWDLIQKPTAMEHVAAPLVKFIPRDGAFPERWAAGEYRASIYVLGFVPIGEQIIDIEFPPSEDGYFLLRDNGGSKLMREWDHWLVMEPEGSGTRYTDRITLDAGFLTPIAAIFVRLFFLHRQRRLRAMVEKLNPA